MNSSQIGISVAPPDSLIKFDAPLFVGISPSADAGANIRTLNENGSKLDVMMNSMLPPRLVFIFKFSIIPKYLF